MQVRLSAVPVRELGKRDGGETSAVVRERVERARTRQRTRYRSLPRVRCNAHVSGRWLDTRTPVDSDARDLLASAAERCGLSARAYHRVLKVSRTIADLDDSSAVAWTHVAEALRYRPLDARALDVRSVVEVEPAAIAATTTPSAPAAAP